MRHVMRCVFPSLMFEQSSKLRELGHCHRTEVFAEETPGLESVPTGLARYEDLLMEVELNVGLDITQSLLSQATQAAGERRIGIHVEVLINLLINLGVVGDVLEALHGIIGKKNILYGEKTRGLGLFCLYPFLFYCIHHFI